MKARTRILKEVERYLTLGLCSNYSVPGHVGLIIVLECHLVSWIGLISCIEFLKNVNIWLSNTFSKCQIFPLIFNSPSCYMTSYIITHSHWLSLFACLPSQPIREQQAPSLCSHCQHLAARSDTNPAWPGLLPTWHMGIWDMQRPMFAKIPMVWKAILESLTRGFWICAYFSDL